MGMVADVARIKRIRTFSSDNHVCIFHPVVADFIIQEAWSLDLPPSVIRLRLFPYPMLPTTPRVGKCGVLSDCLINIGCDSYALTVVRQA